MVNGPAATIVAAKRAPANATASLRGVMVPSLRHNDPTIGQTSNVRSGRRPIWILSSGSPLCPGCCKRPATRGSELEANAFLQALLSGSARLPLEHRGDDRGSTGPLATLASPPLPPERSA